MNVIRLHEAPPAAKPTSGNIQEGKKIEAAFVSLCTVNWSQNSIDQLDTISGAINKSVRWERSAKQIEMIAAVLEERIITR